MGTKKAKVVTRKKGEALPAWAGHCGTVSEMVTKTVGDDGKKTFIAQDDLGFYLTTEAWVDRKFADPNRNSELRYETEELAFLAIS